MQSKKHSLMESVANTLVGYVVAIVSQFIILPWFDVHLSVSDNLLIGLCFVCISIARGYAMRRLFNYLENRKRYFQAFSDSAGLSTAAFR